MRETTKAEVMTLVSKEERLFIAFTTLDRLRSWIKTQTDYIEIPFSKLAVAALEKGIDALVLDPGMPVARRLDRTALNELVAHDRRN